MMIAGDVITALEPLRWGWLELTLEALDHVPLEGFLGPTLRGFFGHALRDACCGPDGLPAFGEGSAYDAVFEAPLTAPGEQDRPPPYILHAPPGPVRHLERGERLSFALALFGEAVQHLPTMLWSIYRYGLAQGLSRERRQVLLHEAIVQTPQERIPVFRAEGGPVADRWLPAWTWTPSRWLAHRMAGLPEDPTEVTLQLVTPLDLLEQKQTVQAVHFHHLFRSAMRSAYAHIRFNCAGRLELDHRGLADASRAIEKVRDATDMVEIERESSRRQQRVTVRGRVGRLTFQGMLAPFLPLLLTSEIYGLGKQRTMGFGAVRVLI